MQLLAILQKGLSPNPKIKEEVSIRPKILQLKYKNISCSLLVLLLVFLFAFYYVNINFDNKTNKDIIMSNTPIKTESFFVRGKPLNHAFFV